MYCTTLFSHFFLLNFFPVLNWKGGFKREEEERRELRRILCSTPNPNFEPSPKKEPLLSFPQKVLMIFPDSTKRAPQFLDDLLEAEEAKKSQQLTIDVQLGERAVLPCFTRGFPAPITRWELQYSKAFPSLFFFASGLTCGNHSFGRLEGRLEKKRKEEKKENLFH